jgi:hypothetical protein
VDRPALLSAGHRCAGRIRRLGVGGSALLILLAACALPACALPAWAQTAEDGYFAARNAASAELKQLAQDPEYNPSKDLGKPELFAPAFRREYDRRRAAVEVMLRDVLGPLPPLPGFAKVGVLNPALCCYGRFGALDGLSYEGQGGNRIIVSTKSLLEHWLNESTDFWPADKKPSSDLSILFTTPSFYRWSGAMDWPVGKLVDLPIGLTDNASAIGAFFAAARPGANWIALAVAKGPKVYVSFFQARTPARPIAACEGMPAATYGYCWRDHVREQPWFDDLLLEVVALADSLPP